MEPRLATPVIWVRAVVAGSFAYFLGLAGHVVAGGPVASTALLVVLFAAVVAGSVPFLARPASARRMLVLLSGGQVFIHVGLDLIAGHHDESAPVAAGTGPQGGLIPLDVLVDLSGHLLAAAVVGFWLAHGERRVFAVLQLTARWVLTRTRPAVVVSLPLVSHTRLATVVRVGFRDLLLGAVVSRRGPPLIGS